METFTGIRNILDYIAQTSSTVEKVEIIKKHEQNELFRSVVVYALDPYKTFKMTGKIAQTNSKRRSKECTLQEYIFYKLDSFTKRKALKKNERATFERTVRSGGSAVVDIVNRILNKDLRCGANVALFRKASSWFEENIPVHFPMKGYDDVEAFIKKIGGLQNAVWSYKLDGTRCWAVVDLQEQNITYLSFNGKELPNFKVFDTEIWKYANSLNNFLMKTVVDQLTFPNRIIFDGEVVDVRGNFTKHMTNFRRLKQVDTSGFRFRIFDFIAEGIKGKSYNMFSYRYHAMLQMKAPIWTPSQRTKIDEEHKVSVLEHYAYHNFPIPELLKTALHAGLEGLMLKNKSYEYQSKRSRDWCKVKQFETEDLPVIGIVGGTGKYEGSLGALVVERNGVRVEVGSGFTDAERKEFWIEPPKCIEVQYQEVTDKGSLRFPIFVRVRDDKA